MVYRTIKTIHGRKYLYEQKSVREGGKVVTTSNYIAPLGEVIYNTITGINGAILLKDGTLLEPFLDEFTYDRATKKALLKHDLQSGKEQAKSPPKTQPVFNLTSRTVPVSVSANLKKFNISERSIIEQARRVEKLFSYLGLSVDNLPKIKIKKGSDFSFSNSSFFCKTPTLFVPAPKSRISKIMAKPKDRRKKVNRHLPKTYKLPEQSHRNQFYSEYGKALARVFLDHLEKVDNQRFSEIERVFQSSFKSKNKGISTYLKLAPKPTTTHYYFNLTGSLTQFFQAKFKPSFFGLTDWQPRKNWRDDYTALVSLIMKHGYEHAVKGIREDMSRQMQLIASIGRKIHSLGFLERLSGKARTLTRNQHRQKARLEALSCTHSQIEALHMPFHKLEKRGRGDF